ncbi:AMP-binding protein [Nakamurella flavida]|uniref:AMP-binding protein n=1 Tax=Nakamurella flavida TaxID=363630 RepID=A0A938YGZ5_9ACTN|nr:AMP-binding protein [Nakamurella flavida]MBM9475747.1 AMP-binding protein [Nakamurella flavida]MDP9777973.1 long-chain acyl-CoA synthetase [Nakamurella flavida]
MNTDPPVSRPETASRPPRNVADLVRSAAVRFGDRPALLSSGPERTWAQVDAAVDAGVADLARFGLGVGERVVVALPSGPDLVVTLLALARAGLVAVPIGPDRRDVGAVADLVGAAAAIALDRGHWLPIAIDAPRVAQWWDRTPAGGAPTESTPAVAGGEDLVWLARAGRGPRPVMISHRAILAGSAAVPALPGLALTGDDRVLQLLPLHHLAGWVTSFLPLTVVGGAAVHPDPVPPTAAADPHPARGPARAGLVAIARHRATVLPTTPGLCHELLTAPGAAQALASVRLITSATAPLAPADVALAREVTSRPVWEGYGITESCGVVTSTLTTAEPRLGSVGRALPGVQVRIVGQDGRDVEPAPGPQPSDDTDDGGGLDDPSADLGSDGEVGRIVVRSPSLFSGYWPDGKAGPGVDGWFVTGDLGYQDETGELRLVDRFAETISVSGFTVYPREVEDVLRAHPRVAQAAVVGVPGPAGQQVVAVYTVRPAPGTGEDETADPADGSAGGDGAAVDGADGAPAVTAGAEPSGEVAEVAEGAGATDRADGARTQDRPSTAAPSKAVTSEAVTWKAATSKDAPPAGAPLTVAELRAHVEAHLAQFKYPAAYQQVPTLPRTEVGRIDRPEVARDYVRTWGRHRPPQLTAVPPSGATPDDAGSPDDAAVDVTPEQVGDITQLGTRLPAPGDRRHRGRRDTDDDLF